MKNIFTIKEAFKDGFEKTKKYWVIVLGALALTWAISFAFEMVNNILVGDKYSSPSFIALTLSLIVTLISVAFSILINYNFMKMILRLHDGHASKIMDILHYDKANLKKVIYFFLASLLYGIIVLVGLILLIIPGIYFAIKYGYALYFMIDKNMGIEESFKASDKITKGQIWNIFVFAFACMLAVAAGLIALFIGAIPAYFIVMFANIYVYKKLSAHHNETSHSVTHHADHHA